MSKQGINNILKVALAADEVDIEEGRVAYFRYRETCLHIAQYHGFTLEEVVAVFAALSPQNSYYGNLRSLVGVLIGHNEGIPEEFIHVSTYRACRGRAFTYLNGVSFPHTVKGNKILSFYQNILNPLNNYAVTIDGHAVNIWRGARVNLQGIKKFNYEEVARDYRETAARLKLIPSQLQALTWFAWKRINNIIYSPPQFHLFNEREGDLWKTYYAPEDIKPFPFG